MRPRLLDLFCGAGGCSVGYTLAGFEVVGVDHKPQPRYPFEFVQGDALEYLAAHGHEFDAIHASPPCQSHVKGLAAVNRARGRVLGHVDLIGETRGLLDATGKPWAIENVEGSPLRRPIRLCGSSFGLSVRRHRLFESNKFLFGLDCLHGRQREAKYPTNWRPNGERRLARVVQVYGQAAGTHLWPAAMGIDWMTRDELAQAIPPAYTRFIGAQLLNVIPAQIAGGAA